MKTIKDNFQSFFQIGCKKNMVHGFKNKTIIYLINVLQQQKGTDHPLNDQIQAPLMKRARFHTAASAQKVAKHNTNMRNKIMLSRIRLPALKLPCHRCNLLLVSCSLLLSRQLLSNVFCLSSSMKLGHVFVRVSIKTSI